MASETLAPGSRASRTSPAIRGFQCTEPGTAPAISPAPLRGTRLAAVSSAFGHRRFRSSCLALTCCSVRAWGVCPGRGTRARAYRAPASYRVVALDPTFVPIVEHPRRKGGKSRWTGAQAYRLGHATLGSARLPFAPARLDAEPETFEAAFVEQVVFVVSE